MSCRNIIGIILGAILATAGAPLSGAQSPAQRYERDSEHPEYSPGRLIVRFKKAATLERSQAAHARANARVLYRYQKAAGLESVKLPAGLSVQEALAIYRANADVEFAEPDYVVRIVVTPADPQYATLWGMQSISAEQAWNLTTGSHNVVVGILDTGIDYNHEDLAANVFRNEADCNTNGMDDDGNGFIDDCYGINTLTDTSDPMDDHSHGTHVAGTIGAVGNNNIGIAGVNWAVKLFACKFLDHNGSGTLSGALKCFDYFALMKDRGVNIVATNNSWSNSIENPGVNLLAQSASLYEAIHGHYQRGILTFFAASNKSSNNDLPDAGRAATTDLPNLVSVAAIDVGDKLAGFSNYGRHSVHFAAPGVAVLSTVPKALSPSGYKAYSGTSMASPHGAGVAALLKAHNPSLDWLSIKNLMMAGTVAVAGAAETITRGKLDVFQAMTCTNSAVQARLLPSMNQVVAAVGETIRLRALNINCAAPNGTVTITASPSGDVITLLDDGAGHDQVAGDGIYSGEWTVPSDGTHNLAFPNQDDVSIHIMKPYAYTKVNEPYRNITGTGLNVFNNGVGFFGEVRPPFPIKFGGTSVSTAYVMMRGMVGFFAPAYTDLARGGLPLPQESMQVFVAPFWDFLNDRLFPDAQGVFWEVTGTAPNRELVIEWRQMTRDTNNDIEAGSFEVVFFEDKDDVLFLYKDVVFGGSNTAGDNGALATVGIQVSPKFSTQYSYHSPVLADGDAIRWTLTDTSPPAPTLAEITPSRIPANTPDFTMSLTGTNFAAGSVVRLHTRFTARSLATTFVDPSHLTAIVPATEIVTTNTMWVTVSTPGLGESNGKDLDVLLPIGPVLNSISPSSLPINSAAMTLVVSGSGFVNGGVIRWNGADRATVYSGPTQLTAAITAADLATAGAMPVTVFQNGTSSAPLQFMITDFRIALNGAGSKSVAAGTTATYDLQIEPLHGSFDRAVQFSCSGLPAASQCTFSPSTVTAGSAVVGVQLSIRTTARSQSAATLHVPISVPTNLPAAPWWAVTIILALAALSRSRMRQPRHAFCLTTIVAIALLAVACGGGSPSATQPPPPPAGTPAGTSIVMVSANSSGTIRTLNVTLVVQ